MTHNSKFIGHPVRAVFVIAAVVAALSLIAVPEQNPFFATIFGLVYGSILGLFAIGIAHCGSWWAVRWYSILTFVPFGIAGSLSVAIWLAIRSEQLEAAMKWVPKVCDALLVLLALWFFIGMILAGFGWAAYARKDDPLREHNEPTNG